MKLYTLQECFEACGSKFPFTVTWHGVGGTSAIYRKEFIVVGKLGSSWIHEPDPSGDLFTIYLAVQNSFDYKTTLYKQDFDSILDKTE